MSDTTRFVAIVPSQGSAYYLEGGEGLIQVPLDEGYAYVAGPHVHQPDTDGGEVDWERGFPSLAAAEPVRQVERILRCLPEDATAPGSDPVLLSRSDLSALLAAIGAARVRAADAYVAEARNFKAAGEPKAAEEQEHAGLLMRRNGEQLLEAAGAISISKIPLADLTALMPKVRWRDTDIRP